MSESRLEDVNDNAGVASKAAVGLRPTLLGEGDYKMVLVDTTEIPVTLAANSNFFPIEKGATIKNTDDSPIAADLVYFIYWA